VEARIRGLSPLLAFPRRLGSSEIVGTLTERLRELERHQAVRRELLSGSVPGARYSLTPRGHALARLLCELEEWGAKTLPAPMIVSPAAEWRTFRSAAHTP
jgi:DNA-binding HxlR family transcriptional regulator